MTIAGGTKIGPFEVLELLGAGGMGAVYRAYDPRLRRAVALKLLPEGFSENAERVGRFEQEALAIARLSHPNIVAVHDVGSHGGSPYLVTEYLEGETLRHKLSAGAIPATRAIDYAVQIACGLSAAHEQGIVHRDIKPENLLVTRDDRVKILDFGLAKLTEIDGDADATAVTLTVPGFGPLGTAAYMSPEQARGARADHRSDLFSLGVVLYELLTGISPFRRETTAETMTAVLRDNVELPVTGPVGDPALRRLLRRCLQKDPTERFQNARDLAFDLAGLTDVTVTAPQDAPSRRHWTRRMLFPAAALVLGAAMGFAVAFRAAESRQPNDIHTVYRLTDFSGLEEFPAIAPDMKSVAFTARVNGYRQIFLRLMAGGTPLQITQDPLDHQWPRWSHDGSAIFYYSPGTGDRIQGTLWQIPALGGEPRRVSDSVGGVDVNREGRLAYFRLSNAHIELVTGALEGAEVRVITRFSEALYYTHPRWSPDLKSIAYQRGDGVRWDMFVIRADATASGQEQPRRLTRDSAQIYGFAWRSDSTGIVYSSSRGDTMPYLPTLGLWELRLDGEVRRVAPADVSYLYPDIHESGLMVATRLRMAFDLWTYPTTGSDAQNTQAAVRLTRQTAQVQTPTVGARSGDVAFLSDSGGHANVWVMSADSGAMRQITYERDPAIALGVPIWSPDGGSIAFVSSRGDVGLNFGVWLVNPDGSDLRQLVARGLGVGWSRDSKWVYYVEGDAIHKTPAAGGAAIRVRPGPARNVIGHDGATLYFVVDRTLSDGAQGFEIHAASPEDAPSRVLAWIAASRAPQWQIINPALSPDGQSLAMPLTDGVTTNIWGLSLPAGDWRRLTDFGDRPTFIARRVSWSADGRSVLAAVAEGDADVVAFEAR